MIIVGVFALAKLVDPIEQFLFELSGGTGFGTPEKVGNGFAWPGLDIVGATGDPPSAQTFAFSFFDTPGTVVLFCGLLTIAALRINLGAAQRTYGETLDQLKLAIVTVMAVLGLASSARAITRRADSFDSRWRPARRETRPSRVL